MAKLLEKYGFVEVESYIPSQTSGLHGKVHIRPRAGQGYPTTMKVECAKKLSNDFPVGTKFRIWAKLTDREGSGDYLYSHFGSNYDVIP
jgi:hypothetical protein